MRRQVFAILALAGLGAATAAVLSGSAAAFPRICSGTACHGSATDSFTGVDVCQPGTTVYWEDSFLPANAIAPHVTSFKITPAPPCTGATVSAAMPDAWPADPKNPDGSDARPREGEATFRIKWSVTVPSGSTKVGTMQAAWSIAWTEPAGSTGPGKTTTNPAHGNRFDFDVRSSGPAEINSVKFPHRFTVTVTVFNRGPGPSPTDELNVSAELQITPSEFTYMSVQEASGCDLKIRDFPTCEVRALPPNGKESFNLVLEWTKSDYHWMFGKNALEAEIHVRGNINVKACGTQETSCSNNDSFRLIAVR